MDRMICNNEDIEQAMDKCMYTQKVFNFFFFTWSSTEVELVSTWSLCTAQFRGRHRHL